MEKPEEDKLRKLGEMNRNERIDYLIKDDNVPANHVAAVRYVALGLIKDQKYKTLELATSLAVAAEEKFKQEVLKTATPVGKNEPDVDPTRNPDIYKRAVIDGKVYHVTRTQSDQIEQNRSRTYTADALRDKYVKNYAMEKLQSFADTEIEHVAHAVEASADYKVIKPKDAKKEPENTKPFDNNLVNNLKPPLPELAKGSGREHA